MDQFVIYSLSGLTDFRCVFGMTVRLNPKIVDVFFQNGNIALLS